MGDFDYTCALSGLPIGEGEHVRLLLLQSSPFNRHGGIGGDLVWNLRALPLRGRYNGYGVVEDIDKADLLLQENMLAGLDVDMCEKGWGDNTVRDTPVRKKMTLKGLFEALRRGRVQVRADLETKAERAALRQYRKTLAAAQRERTGAKKPSVSKGIPTMRRIERAIAKARSITYTVTPENVVFGPGGRYVYEPPRETAFPPEYDPHKGFGIGTRIGDDPKHPGGVGWSLYLGQLGNENHKLIVDKLRRGEIRVRVGGHGSAIEASLRLEGLARKLRRRYAVMVGSGEHGAPTLIVQPRPGALDGAHAFDFYTRRGRKGEPSRLHVDYAIVREDVWVAMLALTASNTIGWYRDQAMKAWAAFLNAAASTTVSKVTPTLLRDFTSSWDAIDNDVALFVTHNPSYPGFSMAMTIALFMLRQPPLTKAETEHVIETLAQTAFIADTMAILRMKFRPVGSDGPQGGEWRAHHQFLRKITSIARRIARRVEIEEAEQRGWEKRYKQEQAKKKAAAKKK